MQYFIWFFILVNLSLFGYTSSYLRDDFLKHIKKEEVHFILELGGYDFEDTLLLEAYYKCPLITFEPNPQLIQEHSHKILNKPNIQLENKGAWDVSKELTFFICKFPGASSFYPIDYKSLGSWNKKTSKEMKERYPMFPISVSAVRLDEYLMNIGNPKVDLLCMDVQGGALSVLKGLGKKLQEIKYIITEVEYNRIYKGEALFPEILEFMKSNGFDCYGISDSSSLFGDVLFIRRDE